MEMLGEIYTSVVDFWDAPVIVFSMILGMVYMLYAARNVARAYIETGEIRQWLPGGAGSPLEEFLSPYITFGAIGGFLLFVVPSFLLAMWPFVVILLLVTGIVIIPIRRERKRFQFMQALKGEDQ